MNYLEMGMKRRKKYRWWGYGKMGKKGGSADGLMDGSRDGWMDGWMDVVR